MTDLGFLRRLTEIESRLDGLGKALLVVEKRLNLPNLEMDRIRHNEVWVEHYRNERELLLTRAEKAEALLKEWLKHWETEGIAMAPVNATRNHLSPIAAPPLK